MPGAILYIFYIIMFDCNISMVTLTMTVFTTSCHTYINERQQRTVVTSQPAQSYIRHGRHPLALAALHGPEEGRRWQWLAGRRVCRAWSDTSWIYNPRPPIHPQPPHHHPYESALPVTIWSPGRCQLAGLFSPCFLHDPSLCWSCEGRINKGSNGCELEKSCQRVYLCVSVVSLRCKNLSYVCFWNMITTLKGWSMLQWFNLLF